MALAPWYPEGTNASPFSGEQRTLVKINAILSGGGGGGFGIGTLTGAGSPNGSVSGSVGQLYLQTSDDSLWTNTDGGTTWTLVTAAVSGPGLYSGVGSPEGVVTAPTGSLYTQTDNGQLWNKVSGAGNVGWL